MNIIMLGYAGQSGARSLAVTHRLSLLRELPSSIVKEAAREYPPCNVPDEAEWFARAQLKDGGILRGLWILSQKMQCGFEVDIRKIPVTQESVEVCEILNADIYSLPSGGGWLLAAAKADEVLALCRKKNIPASCIGITIREHVRALRLGDTVRYLEGP